MARKRPKMPPKLRTLIYIRDGWTCVDCGWRVPEEALARYNGVNAPLVQVGTKRVQVEWKPSWTDKPEIRRYADRPVFRELQIDHIVPLFHGGSFDDPSNLQAMCSTCNYRKGSKVAVA